MNPKAYQALLDSPIAVVILDFGFYDSLGDEALELAILLRKPVLLISEPGRGVGIPPAFEEYDGPKFHVEVDSITDEKALNDWKPDIRAFFAENGVDVHIETVSFPYDENGERTTNESES